MSYFAPTKEAVISPRIVGDLKLIEGKKSPIVAIGGNLLDAKKNLIQEANQAQYAVLYKNYEGLITKYESKKAYEDHIAAELEAMAKLKAIQDKLAKP